MGRRDVTDVEERGVGEATEDGRASRSHGGGPARSVGAPMKAPPALWELGRRWNAGEFPLDVDEMEVDKAASVGERIMERVARLTSLEPEESSLSIREARVIRWLHRYGPTRVGRLSEVVQAPLSTTSELIGELAAKGLVEKVRDPKDRRAVLVVLTGEGLERAEGYRQHQREAFRRILAYMDPEVRLVFLDALAVVESVLEHSVYLQELGRQKEGEP